MIIGDAGAVVQVNFWTPAAEQVESLVRKPFEEEDQFVRVHVVGAEIVELAARPQRVVRLQSTKQTVVQVRGAAGVFSKLEARDGEVAVVSGHCDTFECCPAGPVRGEHALVSAGGFGRDRDSYHDAWARMLRPRFGARSSFADVLGLCFGTSADPR